MKHTFFIVRPPSPPPQALDEWAETSYEDPSFIAHHDHPDVLTDALQFRSILDEFAGSTEIQCAYFILTVVFEVSSLYIDVIPHPASLPRPWDYSVPDDVDSNLLTSMNCTATTEDNSYPAGATSSPTTLEIIAEEPSSFNTRETLSGNRTRRRQLKCSHFACNRKFTNEHTRLIHMKTHQRTPPQPLPCMYGCSENFSRQHDRFRHEVLKHGRPSEWTCNKCHGFFSTEKTLSNHKCSVNTRWKAIQHRTYARF